MRNRKFPKNFKESQKIKKKPLWLHFKPKQVATGGERDKIKIIIPFPSDPTHDRKFKKNKKYSYVFFSSQNRFEKDEKMRK